MNDQVAGTIPILGVVDVHAADPAARWPVTFCHRTTTRCHRDADAGREFTGRHAVVFPPEVLIAWELFGYRRSSERGLRRHLDTAAVRR